MSNHAALLIEIEMMREAIATAERQAAVRERHAQLRASCEGRGVDWIRPMTPTEIIFLVAEQHGVGARDLVAYSQARHINRARQEAMWTLRQLKHDDGTHRFSLVKIGQLLGGRDHTTIREGVAAHARRMAQPAPADAAQPIRALKEAA